MSSLRFAPEAESQLQRAYQQLHNSERQRSYDRIVSTLISLERDAALFTLVEASAFQTAAISLYGVIHELEPPATPVVIVYALSADADDVVIHSISW